MPSIKRKINGDTWKITVVTEKQMKKIRGPEHDAAGGLCVPSEKTIYLDEECIEYETVSHELFHAYVSNLHLDDTNELKFGDIEEIFAGMFAAKGDKMVRQAKRIVKDLIKLTTEE